MIKKPNTFKIGDRVICKRICDCLNVVGKVVMVDEDECYTVCFDNHLWKELNESELEYIAEGLKDWHKSLYDRVRDLIEEDPAAVRRYLGDTLFSNEFIAKSEEID